MENKKYLIVGAVVTVLIGVLLFIVIKGIKEDRNRNVSSSDAAFHKPKDFTEIQMIDIRKGNNNITVAPSRNTISYYSYDSSGMESPVKELSTASTKEQQNYIMDKVVSNLNDTECKENSKWCVLIKVAGGSSAASGDKTPTWFNNLLSKYKYDSYFRD